MALGQLTHRESIYSDEVDRLYRSMLTPLKKARKKEVFEDGCRRDKVIRRLDKDGPRNRLVREKLVEMER